MSKRRCSASHVSKGLALLLKRSWPFLASAALVIFSLFIWMLTPSSEEATHLATFASGFASIIALIWLVAGFRLQSTELSLQRRELELQRLAAEQQARELNNSAKLGSLGQIRSLLEDAERFVRDSPLGISSPSELQKVFLEKMNLWDRIENSNTSSEVTSAYGDWLPVESVTRNYVKYVSSALQIYIQFHCPSSELDLTKDPEEFVYVYQSWGLKAPFLSHHIGVATLLAQTLWMMSPGLERMRLAWLVASAKFLGTSMMKEGTLEELRDKVLERSDTLPAICSPWPT